MMVPVPSHATTAHGHERVLTTGALQFVQGGRDQASARATRRVTQRYGTTVHIDFTVIDTEIFLPRQEPLRQRPR